MKKQPGLEIAEYVSLAGSFLGTIVAVTSGKLVFAAAPLTVALSLNLINRRRFQQETIDYTSGILTEAQEAFQGLHEQVKAMPALNLKLDTISQKFDTRPEMQLLRQSENAIAQLSSRLDVLKPLNEQSTALEASLGGVKEAITDIYNQLNSLSSNIQASTTPNFDFTSVGEGFADIHNQLNAITSQLDKPTATVDLSEVENAIASLNTQLNAVTLRLDEPSTPPLVDLSEVENAIASLNTQLNAVTLRLDEPSAPTENNFSEAEYAILDINTQLDVLNQQFNSRSEAQAIEQLQREIPQIFEQLNSLTLRLDNSPTPQVVDLSSLEEAIAQHTEQLSTLGLHLDRATPQVVDLSGIETAITNINNRLDSFTLRLDELPTTQAVNLSGVETAITQINQSFDALNQQFNTRPETQAIQQLQGAMPQLSEQLNAMMLRMDATQTVDLSGIETAITNINNRLDSFTLRLDELPTTQAVNLSGVETAITQINQSFDALNQQFNTRPETQAIQQLQGAMPQLSEQLNAMILRVDATQTVDLSGIETAITDINNRLDSVTQRLDTPTTQAVDLSGVEGMITDINSRLNVLNQQFNAQLENQKIEQLKSSIPQLKEQVNFMTLRLDTLAKSSDIDFSQEQEIIADVNFQLDTITQRLDHPPGSLKIDHNEIDETLSGINFQLRALALDLETIPDPMVAVDLRGGEESIDVINSQINNINLQFNTQTEVLNREQIEQTISVHLEQMKDMELRVNSLSKLSDAELKKEKKAIANINLGLEALVLFLEEVPADSDIDLTEVVIALGDINSQVDAYTQHLDTLLTA